MMYEQADQGREGPIYSWVLTAPYRMRSQLPGWKWIRGVGCRGVFSTNDASLALAMATKLDLVIGSNGTHAALGVPMSKAAVATFKGVCHA